MKNRIDSLSKAEKARFDEWADKWIAIGLRTGKGDRKLFETSVRDCYRFAGLEPPKVIIWVPSPIVVALAAPVASLLIEINRINAVDSAVDGAVDSAVRGAVDRAVRGAVRGAVGGAVDGAVDSAVRGAVDRAVRGAVDRAVRGAVRGAVGGAVDSAVRGAVRGAVGGAVRGAVDSAVGGAVRGAVDSAVDGAVGGAVRGAVGGAVGGAVDSAVRGAVDSAVRGAVDSAVRGAVRGAVGGAVDSAVKKVISSGWDKYIGGQFWVSGWYYGVAWTSFFREVCGLELPVWDRAKAYEGTAQSACWWYPHKDFVMVCEHPDAVLLEQIGPRGPGSHRLHCDNGPAIVWPDGWGIYSVHGVIVPDWVITNPEKINVKNIEKETNQEVKRVMIERIGWERFLVATGAKRLNKRYNERDCQWEELYEGGRVALTDPSTGRKYVLGVPKEITTCEQAQLWMSHGLDKFAVHRS